ncbi:hypothetical protein SAMN06265222_114120 [Neorhodopirellula lusitana]|uniref:HAMP domain-containing protein n=1 Tax=Neorhodopirellula lusitana TaxID=445327 RepID=A0ABY1QHR4_9BACT|nr:hypothetical protein [Neorhodopirellula lusitana]SMP71812.1 hypothetical protein SAMN06265222_114120 [Neorhodopirellula lusitana]
MSNINTDPVEHKSPSKSKFKRNQTVVDKDVQYGVVAKIAIHWVVFMICNSVALMIWMCLFEHPESNWRETAISGFQRFLPFLVVSFALIPAFVLDTLKLTNRFAGPISRLRTELSNATEGRPVRKLKFRSDDYWREIATGFNTLVDQAGLPTQSGKPTK